MFDLQFKINGKTIRPNHIADALEKSILKSIEKDFRSKLVHLSTTSGEHLNVTIKGKNLDNLALELEGPEELVEEAKNLLG